MLNQLPSPSPTEKDAREGADTSLLLGWPTHYESKSRRSQGGPDSLRTRRSAEDLSYAIKYKSDGHLVTFAPTGSGKGVSVIIPNLLHYPGPTIVIDPKGENFAVTARYRRSLGHSILLLDPFKAVSEHALNAANVRRESLNPLDLCRLTGASIENDSQMIADLLSGDGSVGDNPFWDISARKLLSGLIAHEMESSRREGRPPQFRRLIETLFSDDPFYRMAVLLETESPTRFVTMTVGSGFVSLDAKETRDGILTTAQSYLTLMLSSDIGEFLEDSTISLSAIQNDENYTLYIVVPPNKLQSHAFLLKTWVGVLMHAIMERKQLPRQRTLFMLDECANLGEMDVLRKAVTLLRGYGLQVWMFFQDLSQMESLYVQDFKTMINNCGVLQAFGISRRSGAQPLSSIIGQYQLNDLLHMDRAEQVLSIAPGKVRIARLFRYYKDRAFNGRHQDNPLIRKSERSMTPLLDVPRSKSRFG